MYIKLYTLYNDCVYNVIHIRPIWGAWGRLRAIVYIKAYTFICGGFKLCITAIHVFKVAGFDCVYKLYTLLMSGRGFNAAYWLRSC